MQTNNERHPVDKLKISANGPLNGEIIVSGAKNAALPLMCAGLLTSGTLRLKNVPMLADVKTTQKLLQGMGARVLTDNISEFEINGGTVNNTCAPYELVKTMRASILVLGPTLARFGEAQVSLPGGCAIGSRPVDQHLKGLETMGAEITIEHGYVKAKGRLKGTRVTMDVVTVGGTENLLMAATLAEGTTILENCAIEPEVVDLAECLVKMGAKISGIGTSTMTVEGVKELHGCEHSVVPGPHRSRYLPLRRRHDRRQSRPAQCRPKNHGSCVKQTDRSRRHHRSRRQLDFHRHAATPQSRGHPHRRPPRLPDRHARRSLWP